MSKETTRRQFVSMAGLGAIGFLGGCSEGSFRNEGSAATSRATTRSATDAGSTRTRTTETDTDTDSSDDESVHHDHQADTTNFADETLTRARVLGQTVQRSVVKLTSGGAGGTGWIIESGYILTNSHVTRDFETMDVETFDGRTGTATRVGYHEDMLPDIALMKTEMETPEPLPMKTETGVAKGDPVLTVGHPGRVGDWVISLGRYETYNQGINWELSDIPTSQGNSGSPILTLDGVVFGCISGTTTMNGGSSRVDRSEKVFTEFPARRNLATATPSKTIEKWVGEWK